MVNNSSLANIDTRCLLVDGGAAFQQLLEVFVFRAHEPVERPFGACNGLPHRIATLGKDVRLGFELELALGSASRVM